MERVRKAFSSEIARCSACQLSLMSDTAINCALHEVSPASLRPAMHKRLAGVRRQRLALNKHLEAQPAWPRHEPRERRRAGRGVEEAGDEGARPRGDRRILQRGTHAQEAIADSKARLDLVLQSGLVSVLLHPHKASSGAAKNGTAQLASLVNTLPRLEGRILDSVI